MTVCRGDILFRQAFHGDIQARARLEIINHFVWRIQKDQAERYKVWNIFGSKGREQCIGFPAECGVFRSDVFHIAFEQFVCFVVLFNEDHAGGPSAESFQPEGTGTRIDIGHAFVFYGVAQPFKQNFFDKVGYGSGGLPGIRMQFPSTIFACNNSHCNAISIERV